MNEKVISVVIPVYNVEKYLDRCVNSVVNQSYKNLEIILIDDGSPDKCPEMCEEWAKKDSRIKVIHKENQGLGMARNTGIENATGEYICFFDSDDYVDTELIEKAYHLAKQTHAEIVTFGMTVVDANGEIKSVNIPGARKPVFSGAEVKTELLPDLVNCSNRKAKNRNIYMSICTNLFRMELLKRASWKVISEREVISEDSFSLLVLYKDVETVAILEEAGYYYCHNENSLTHRYQKDRYEQIKKFFLKFTETIEWLGYADEVKKRLARRVLGLSISAVKQITVAEIPYSRRLEQLKKILQDDTMICVLNETDRKDDTKKQRVLFYFMRKRRLFAVYCLAKAQALSDTGKLRRRK